MKIFGYEFGKKEVRIERKAVLGLNDSLSSFLLLSSGGNGSTPASALNLFKSSSAVSIPINRIVTAIQNMNFVMEREDGTIEAVHPALDLLKKPSPFYTKSLFMETIAKDFLITGEMPIVAIGGLERPPIELQPISPDKMSINKGNNGNVAAIAISGETMAGSYIPLRKGKDVRYIRDPLSEIHITRNFQTRDNSLLRGESLLVSASSEVRQHILGGTHNVSLLEKGGRLSLIFHFTENLDDDAFQERKDRVKEQYGGAGNAGEIAVTAGDGSMEIKEIGTKNKDMDFVNLQKMAKIAIASQYGFPLVLLDTDAATFNNYEAAKEALYDDAAIPFAEIILEGLSNFLLPRFNEDPTKIKFAIDMDKIPALTMRRNRELKIRKDIGIESYNELREALPNRNDVKGGEEILIPANMIPISTDQEAFSNPSLFPDKTE